MRKVCVVTGSRAEYGLLYWLLEELRHTRDVQLQLVVTGMHLSPQHGLTVNQVIDDGFSVDAAVDMLLASDSPVAVAKSTGVGVMGFADAFARLAPDLVVVLGDRFEVLSAATATLFSKIPLAHIHGGEVTEGAVDESIRHAITKMSHLHFTATETYRRRVIQMGERPECVFNVGALGLDGIDKVAPMSRPEFEAAAHFEFGKRNLMVTYHPATLGQCSPAAEFGELLAALDACADVRILFTKPNADPGGRQLARMIDDYVERNPGRCRAFVSMGQKLYLSALRFVDAVVGNSSSGLIEAPSLGIGTINIGTRQKGRLRASSVIDCEGTREAISAGLQRLYSAKFQQSLRAIDNPYGSGGAAARITRVLVSVDLDRLVPKRFYDLDAETVQTRAQGSPGAGKS